MTAYVALLRAVNVGGTGKLPMATLAGLCEAAGFNQVRTYLASGNAVFASDADEDAVRTALEARLQAYAGKPLSVIVRSAAEMAAVLARNPFTDRPGNRVMALFVDASLPDDPLAEAKGLVDEEVRAGARELFIAYPNGAGASRLRLPGERLGTARNMNTVAKLAEMSAALG